MAQTNVSVVIGEGLEESGSLRWVLEDNDNNNPSCYLSGTEYFLRLFKSPDSLDPCVFASNGNIIYVEEIIEEITEDIIFTGDQAKSLSNPYYSGLIYTQIGNVYGSSCVLFSNVSFSISVGSDEIVASVPCFAVLRLTYNTKYYRYRFMANSSGILLIGAIDTYNSEEVKDTITVTINNNCIEEEECPTFSVEVDTSSEEGANYNNQNKKLIRIYNTNLRDIRNIKATRGSLTYLGIEQEEHEEVLTVCDKQVSPEKPAYHIILQYTDSGNLNPFTIEPSDGSLRMIDDPTNEKNGIPKGYGTLYIKYRTKFLKFLISASDVGKGVLLLEHADDADHCSPQCVEYEIGESDGNAIYDITIIYRDFVTGAPLSEVKVWVDDSYIGETDDAGEILIKGMTANVKHRIKGSKPGYLNSESDSLANNAFMIKDDNVNTSADYSSAKDNTYMAKIWGSTR